MTIGNIATANMAVAITDAWLRNPNNFASAEDAATMLNTSHKALDDLLTPPSFPLESAPELYHPAVGVRKSLSLQPEYIISMIDGNKYRTLKRHLATHGLTPAEYRARYGLKPDYPMVATAYSESRSALAKKTGLGRKPGHKVKKN